MASSSNTPASPTLESRIKIRKCQNSDLAQLSDLHRFGPNYFEDEDRVCKNMSREAWKHVERNTGKRPGETMEDYMTAVGGQVVEDAYSKCVRDSLEGQKISRMMVRQSCLFLITTLLILGADADQLKYSAENFIFGSDISEDDLKSRIEKFYMSIVFPGNQIPLLVLKRVMDQPFFKDVVTSKKNWGKPNVGSLQFVLYDLVLGPALKRIHIPKRGWINRYVFVPMLCWNKILGTQTSIPRVVEQPFDILHGLYLYLVGPAEGGEKNSDKRMWKRVGYRDSTEIDIDVEDQDTKWTDSALSLEKAGIRFQSVKGLQITQIRLKWNCIHATLCLPAFDVNTLSVLPDLLDYENTQELEEHNARAFLLFFSDLIPTMEDALFLASQGVIPNEIGVISELADILKKFRIRARNSRPITSKNLACVRVDATRYYQRRKYIYNKIVRYIQFLGKAFIGFLAVYFAATQALYTVLGYYKKGIH